MWARYRFCALRSRSTRPVGFWCTCGRDGIVYVTKNLLKIFIWNITLPPMSTETYRDIKAALRTLYMDDARPWLVGFSGGKDSASGPHLSIRTIQFCVLSVTLKSVNLRIPTETLCQADGKLTCKHRDSVCPKVHELFLSVLRLGMASNRQSNTAVALC